MSAAISGVEKNAGGELGSQVNLFRSKHCSCPLLDSWKAMCCWGVFVLLFCFNKGIGIRMYLGIRNIKCISMMSMVSCLLVKYFVVKSVWSLPKT